MLVRFRLVALAASLAVFAAPAYAGGPCKADAKKFCGGNVKNADKAPCLTSHLSELSKECQARIARGHK